MNPARTYKKRLLDPRWQRSREDADVTTATCTQYRRSLVTGAIVAGALTRYNVHGNPIVAHYVTDGDYVHTGGCFDTFLTEQWNTGGYAEDHAALGYLSYHDTVWEVIVGLGGWTVEWSSREELPDGATCITCGKAVL